MDIDLNVALELDDIEECTQRNRETYTDEDNNGGGTLGMKVKLNVALGLDDISESLQHNKSAEFVENVFPQVEKDQSGGDTNILKSQSTASFEEGKECNSTDERTLLIEIEKKLSVGSCLTNLQQAYLVYCGYAHCKGFSVRKGEQRYFGKGPGDIRWKEFKCSCSGIPDCTRLKKGRRVACYKKLVTRSNCAARLIVSREDLGTFQVSLFEANHNHALVPRDQSYLLRSNRNLNFGQKSVLEALRAVGIGVARACGYMEKECGGPENVGFTRKDAYHHIERLKMTTKVEDGDAKLLVEYFTNKANGEPYFFWKYQLDDNGRLMNLFFRDSRCAVDYDSFGDVMSVDTTYRTNRYNLICAPFVGINHHRSNVLFGMAFMSDETTNSFMWLFETFLESMHGKEPKVIFTDQCQAMMNAIENTFTNAKHRLCQWHINQNAPSHFGNLNGNSKFKRLWYECMNGVDSETEFEVTWSEMMENYNLTENRWFSGMYKLRRRWASVFTRDIFTAGLLATSRSEVTNKVLKEVARSSSSLSDFVRQYEEIQMRWRRKEREEDTLCYGYLGSCGQE